MGNIYSAIRFLLNFITPIFATLLGKVSSSDSTPIGIKGPSQEHIPVRIRRTQVIEVEFHDRPSDHCAAVFDKEKDGSLACAIVHDRRKNPGFWRTLPYVASELAIDLMRRPCETVKWVLMSYTLGSRGEISFEVWEAAVSREDDGSLRVSWREARPEHATEWIRRVETAMGLVPRIRIRQFSTKECHPAA
jgi:hypothetical protein